MDAFLTKDLTQEFAAAIGHQMLLGEGGAGVNQTHDFDNACDFVQITHSGVQSAQQVNGHCACGCFAFFGLQGETQLAGPNSTCIFGDMTTQKNQVARSHKGHIGRRRCGNGWQGDVKLFDAFVDGYGFALLGLIGNENNLNINQHSCKQASCGFISMTVESA